MKKKTSSQSERSSPVSTTVLRAAGVTRCTVLSGFVYVLRKDKEGQRRDVEDEGFESRHVYAIRMTFTPTGRPYYIN